MKSFALTNIDTLITFYKQLTRSQLSRFFVLHHAAVFPSMHPEAFGIVAVEAMASGLALLSSGVGGASEVFENNKSGLQFEPGNAQDLSVQINAYSMSQDYSKHYRKTASTAEKLFDVQRSAKHLEELLHKTNHCKYSSDIQQFDN